MIPVLYGIIGGFVLGNLFAISVRLWLDCRSVDRRFGKKGNFDE